MASRTSEAVRGPGVAPGNRLTRVGTTLAATARSAGGQDEQPWLVNSSTTCTAVGVGCATAGAARVMAAAARPTAVDRVMLISGKARSLVRKAARFGYQAHGM